MMAERVTTVSPHRHGGARIAHHRNDPLRMVIADVAEFFEIPVDRLTNVAWRDRTTIAARKVAAWMLCEEFPYASGTTISLLLGYRERTAASHAVARIERRMMTDPQLRVDIAGLRERLTRSHAEAV